MRRLEALIMISSLDGRPSGLPKAFNFPRPAAAAAFLVDAPTSPTDRITPERYVAKKLWSTLSTHKIVKQS